MTRPGRSILYGAALLLLVTASASAECAWVLWSNFVSSNPASRYAASSGGLWTPESAGTRVECEQARDRMRTGLVAAGAMGAGTRSTGPQAQAAEAVGVIGPEWADELDLPARHH